MEKAIADVIAVGSLRFSFRSYVTSRPTAVGTSQVADAVVAQLKAGA